MHFCIFSHYFLKQWATKGCAHKHTMLTRFPSYHHTHLHLPNIHRLPLHVLHGGVCVGLWKQLGLIIDVLHFNQFHHSVRLIKVSAMLPGAVYVWERVNKKKCVRGGRYVCVFSCSWGLHAPFYISKYMGILYFRKKRMRDGPFLSLSFFHAHSRFLAVSLPLFPSFCACLSLLPLSLPRQEPKCN